MVAQKKIELFHSLRQYFRILGTLSHDPDGNSSFNPRNTFVLFCFVQLFISTVAFSLFEAQNVIDYGLNYYAYTTELLSVFVISFQIRRMVDILKLIENCEKFIAKRKYARITYDEVNKNIERWNKTIYLITANVSSVGVVLPPLLTSAVNYFIYDMKESSYLLPFPVVLPFNWKTPLGYSIALLAQAFDAYFTLLTLASVLCFMVGSCWLFISFAKDISQDLSFLGEDKSAKRSHTDLLKYYCYIIQSYADVKQLVYEFNVLYGYIVLVYFVWTLSTICSSLLVLQSESSSDHISNPIEILNILTAFTQMFWSFAICAFFCEFGETVTQKFNLFDDGISRCNWYSLPIDVQKMHLIFMLNTQQPTVIRGYPNILCTREIFKMTVNQGFSFYMLARQIDPD